MASGQSTLQSTQTNEQTEPQNQVEKEPGVVTIPLDTLVETGKNDMAKAIDSLVFLLAEFFHFSGITNYMVIKFIVDTPSDPFGISVTVPDSEGDLIFGKNASDVEKEIKRLIHEYLVNEKKPPKFTMEGHYATAATESIMEYAKIHGYDGVIFIGKGVEIKSPKDNEFQAILVKFN